MCKGALAECLRSLTSGQLSDIYQYSLEKGVRGSNKDTDLVFIYLDLVLHLDSYVTAYKVSTTI